MQVSTYLLLFTLTSSMSFPTAAQDQKYTEPPSKLLSAKSVFFDDQTGVAAVGGKALGQLKKWGRFQIVQDRKQADLILLLSAEPPHGSQIITAGGQTGRVGNDGNIELDSVPTFNRAAPVRYAYLTVLDPRTGEQLWSDSHRWGGLLTGFNSAGESLIHKLKKQFDK